MIVRRLARPMMAAVFIKGGIDTLLNPEPRVSSAAPLVEKVTTQVGDKLPEQAPTQPAQLVRIDAGVKIGAGVLLALGKLPRTSSLLLAASLVPTTVAGHAFWEKTDPAAKHADQVQFLKNVSMLGGLVLAAVDTEGKPSLGWRGRRAARKLAEKTGELTGSSSGGGAGEALESARSAATSAATSAAGSVRDGVDIAIGTLVS